MLKCGFCVWRPFLRNSPERDPLLSGRAGRACVGNWKRRRARDAGLQVFERCARECVTGAACSLLYYRFCTVNDYRRYERVVWKVERVNCPLYVCRLLVADRAFDTYVNTHVFGLMDDTLKMRETRIN